MLALRRTRTMHRRPLNMDDSTTTRFKFLLVEDDPAMIELESLLLEEAGHTVVALHSSDDALSKIKEHAPDCVLTDIMMPGIDGMQLGADSFITKPMTPKPFRPWSRTSWPICCK